MSNRIVHNRCTVFAGLVCAALAAPLCPAGEYVIRAEEAVFIPGQPALLLGTVQKKHSLAMRDDVRGAMVSFYVDGIYMGQAATNKYGQAFLKIRSVARPGTTIETRTSLKGQTLSDRAPIFNWDANRTIIAVDIDETISKTHYSDLFFAMIDNYSDPVDNAAAVLNRLSKDYHIYYYSARPRFLHEKTHEWLRRHGFPPGPYADALKFEACLQQERYKREILTDLRSRYPNILIGIGDKDADDGAHRDNRMLSLILGRPPLFGYSNASIVCRDWPTIERFFSTHRQRLVTPAALAGIIDTTDLELRPYFERVAAVAMVPAPTAPPAPPAPVREKATEESTARLASAP